MTGKDLKNSILQLAIQGKLVPQNPNDEPASELLARIRQEKERLVKEKKLKKKDLETSPITDEEKPFEIPESWEWCRLGDLFVHASGKQQSGNNKKDGTLRKYITTSNIYWGRFELNVVKEMNFTNVEMQTCSAAKGDLLVCEGGAGYGRSAIWPYDYDICLQNHVHRLRPLVSGTCEYVYHFIYFLKETNQLQSVGTAMPGLSANRLKGLVLPIPPLAEQQRIVAKIEELMPLVEEYDKNEQKLAALNKALPEQLRQSVLQQAIMGKLVPQDENDEPASELLARIRQEKERLVKEKKLKKKDLETSPITDEEKPFEIPESWEWVRLKDICTKIVDGDHNPPAGISNPTEFLMLSSQNINNDKLVNLEKVRYLTKEVFEKEDLRTKARQGDILFTSVGTLGRSCILNEDINICFQRSVTVICTNIYNRYLKRVLDSPSIQTYVFDNATGTAQKGFYINQMEDLVIPLPPLAEQQRIVAKIEELLSVIDNLKTC